MFILNTFFPKKQQKIWQQNKKNVSHILVSKMSRNTFYYNLSLGNAIHRDHDSTLYRGVLQND